MQRSAIRYVSLLLPFLAVACHARASAPDASVPQPTRTLDVLFINGVVIDGTGRQRYEADVGIAGDSIHVIGQDLEVRYDATRVIDITGKFIAPGYIDVHGHADAAVLGDDQRQKAALNLLYQGITTINIGSDGRHARKFDDRRDGQIAGQYRFIDEHGFGMNVFILLGHNNIRLAVMGEGNYKRFSTDAEMREMAGYVRQYMDEGALGMSMGLEYHSGRYSDIDELVYLARALADYDRHSVIISHERATGPQHRYYLPSEHNAQGLYADRFRKYPDGWDVMDYVREGIQIAESSGVVFDFSHFKITHESYWGRSDEVIDLIEAARDRGARIYAEQIAFTNSGNNPMNLSIIPAKYYGERDESVYPFATLQQVLADPQRSELLRNDIAWQIDKHGGGASVEIIDSKSHPEWIGSTLADLSQSWALPDLVDVILRVKEEGDVHRPNGARFRSRQTLSLDDVANLARTDWVGTVTDAGVRDLNGGFAQPRYFASFTNKITQLVKEERAITLEHAIRAGTGLPAMMLSLPDRGRIEEGYKADIQVFDLDELEVKARWTLTDSRAYSEGVEYVLVNGVFALDEGEPTYVLAGRSIRNQDAWGRGERPTAKSAPALPRASAEAAGLSTVALDDLSDALQAFVDSGHLSGIHAVIARDGRIAYEQTFGWRDVANREPLRRDDIFRIYSMTKPVVAVGVLRLVEQGLVALDDPVSKYIPAFAHVKVFDGGTADVPMLRAPASPITVRQLLNHTSGLAYGLTDSPVDTIFRRAQLYDAQHTLQQFTDSLARMPLLFDPGTQWSYSSGLDVAGRVIEVASGRTLDRFLDEALFEPLGMRDTGFRIRPYMRERLASVYAPAAEAAASAPAPAASRSATAPAAARAPESGSASAPGSTSALHPGLRPLGSDGLMAMFEPDARFLWGSGGLLSTPDDFLRFAQMLLNDGTFGDTRILRPETVALMTHNTLPPELTPVAYPSLSDSTYGFGLGVAVKVDTTPAEPNGPPGIFRWSGYLGTYFWVDPANDLVAMVWTQLSPGAAYPLWSVFQDGVYDAVVR